MTREIVNFWKRVDEASRRLDDVQHHHSNLCSLQEWLRSASIKQVNVERSDDMKSCVNKRNTYRNELVESINMLLDVDMSGGCVVDELMNIANKLNKQYDYTDTNVMNDDIAREILQSIVDDNVEQAMNNMITRQTTVMQSAMKSAVSRMMKSHDKSQVLESMLDARFDEQVEDMRALNKLIVWLRCSKTHDIVMRVGCYISRLASRVKERMNCDRPSYVKLRDEEQAWVGKSCAQQQLDQVTQLESEIKNKNIRKAEVKLEMMRMNQSNNNNKMNELLTEKNALKCEIAELTKSVARLKRTIRKIDVRYFPENVKINSNKVCMSFEHCTYVV